jgi:predicted transcriptional regulator
MKCEILLSITERMVRKKNRFLGANINYKKTKQMRDVLVFEGGTT